MSEQEYVRKQLDSLTESTDDLVYRARTINKRAAEVLPTLEQKIAMSTQPVSRAELVDVVRTIREMLQVDRLPDYPGGTGGGNTE